MSSELKSTDNSLGKKIKISFNLEETCNTKSDISPDPECSKCGSNR